jgi:hypothetical protein
MSSQGYRKVEKTEATVKEEKNIRVEGAAVCCLSSQGLQGLKNAYNPILIDILAAAAY